MIQRAKHNKSDLHVVCLDAYESVPHQLIWYAISFFHMAVSVTAQLTVDLKKIDQRPLPGKFKVWCYQFTLLHHLMLPLKLCDIPSSAVLKMDAKANNYIRNWLGLPRCLSSAALFGRNTLRLAGSRQCHRSRSGATCMARQVLDGGEHHPRHGPKPRGRKGNS